jgi:hypothetical protein
VIFWTRESDRPVRVIGGMYGRKYTDTTDIFTLVRSLLSDGEHNHVAIVQVDTCQSAGVTEDLDTIVEPHSRDRELCFDDASYPIPQGGD